MSEPRKKSEIKRPKGVRYTRQGLDLTYLWIMLKRSVAELRERSDDDPVLRTFSFEIQGAAEVISEVMRCEREGQVR